LEYIFTGYVMIRDINIEQQEKVLPLYELYGKFNGYEEIPTIFSDIAQKKQREKKDLSAQKKGVWNNRIRLEYDGNRLGYDVVDTGTLRIRTMGPTVDDPEPVFTVLNGNFNETGPDPTLKVVCYTFNHTFNLIDPLLLPD